MAATLTAHSMMAPPEGKKWAVKLDEIAEELQAEIEGAASMNSLIPWCPIKARNGSYEVVTREGHPVTDWHMFENIDPYPLRAVVDTQQARLFSRTGGYVDGEGERTRTT